MDKIDRESLIKIFKRKHTMTNLFFKKLYKFVLFFYYIVECLRFSHG